MFLHHTMTDQEIIRSCEGCESQHLRLVADRLADRVASLDRIDQAMMTGRANGAPCSVILDSIVTILEESAS